MTESNRIITEFVKHYLQKFDFYELLASLVAMQLRSELDRRGIRAIVSSRAKDPEKLRQKLIRRATRAKDPKVYATLDDIEADIVDLAGVRVALYFPGDQKKVGEVIGEVLETPFQVKRFPEPDSEVLSKGLVGYIAEHYRGQIRTDRLTLSQRRRAQGRVEIQVASLLMHAWAEIDHDLRYKPTQGPPSAEELATLDEVNGLVLTGEIALERLQRLIEERVGRPQAQFQNHYELQEFLSTEVPNISLMEVGNLNFLLPLLKSAGLDTPSLLRPYIQQVLLEQQDRPLADRLIDVITAEEPNRYELFRAVLTEQRAVDETEPEQNRFGMAIADFLENWIALERKIKEMTGSKVLIFESRLLRSKLRDFGVEERDEEEIFRLRKIRNSLLHGQIVLSPAQVEDASRRVRRVLDDLNGLAGASPVGAD